VWATSSGTLRPFNSFLILLNLEKDLSPEKLVTIKLRNKGPRGWINWKPLIKRHQTQTRVCHFIAFSYPFLCLCFRVLWLPVGKMTFAGHSRSSRSSLICSAWEQYKLSQVFNSNLISEWLLKKIKMEKSHLKLPNELYVIEMLTKLQHCSEETTIF